jgi:hypothetical protein
MLSCQLRCRYVVSSVDTSVASPSLRLLSHRGGEGEDVVRFDLRMSSASTSSSSTSLAIRNLNTRNPAIKRLMREAAELENEHNSDFSAAPCDDNIFEWHFTIRGAAGTEFEGGRYHGRILLPSGKAVRLSARSCAVLC